VASENFARYPAACCGELHLGPDTIRNISTMFSTYTEFFRRLLEVRDGLRNVPRKHIIVYTLIARMSQD
jgi:hypothetical protein